MAITSEDVHLARRIGQFLCSRRGAAYARGAIMVCCLVLVVATVLVVIGWMAFGQPATNRIERAERLLAETHDQVFRMTVEASAAKERVADLGRRVNATEQSMFDIRQAEYNDRRDINDLQATAVRTRRLK